MSTMNNKERPVFISVSPFTFAFPFTALASIAHRITGVLLFLGMGYCNQPQAGYQGEEKIKNPYFNKGSHGSVNVI